ncbi:MAG TPA: carboxypeptidase-like regulatory domain-containing protein [Pyrinomonadaceae bacterium]|nr:carboxypeptidase-like regulatory domain-containing protein [Pyrinomonadaceae bacterium]
MPTPNTLRRQSLFAAALLCVIASAPAAFAQKEAPATVSGRVTDGERGAQGVTVMLIYNEPPQRFRVAARAKTDAEGRFLLTNVAPGRYQITPVAPAYVVEGLATNYPPGRPLTVTAGEEVRDIDFKMEAGGVITGRVTDADGNPVVQEVVMVQPVEVAGPPRFNFDSRDRTTDDRGVYRIFGLPPGRYHVSVGRADDSGAVSYGRRKLFRRTFHPDATEQAQARVVEIRSGIEATDVDIKVGRALKTYKVSGRFVTADTNEPVAGVTVGFSTVDARGRRTGGYSGASMTNARGEFVTDGLAPGRYVVHASNTFGPQQETSVFYSDPVHFEVADADVSGLLVKLKRGATVSGVVTIEGVADRAAAARMLSAVRLYTVIDVGPRQVAAPSGPMRPVGVNADGTFQLSGIAPGKLRIGTMNETVKGLSMTRIELNGVNVGGGFDVTEGAQVTGVNVVMTLGTAVLVGQTTYANGTPPPNARVMAFARLVGATPSPGAQRTAEVDARGFFRIDGMTPGEYEFFVQVFDFTPRPGGGPRMRPLRSEPQRVVVGEGGETKVSAVVNFQPEPRKEP